MSQAIRVIAIAVIRKEDSILVFEGYDDVTKEIYYRPLGGGLAFGEYSIDALRREFREELDADLTNLRYLETLENVFTCCGKEGHQVIIIYEGEFVDLAFYRQAEIRGMEDNGEPFKAKWMPLDDFHAGKFPLYPTGLLELLENRK